MNAKSQNLLKTEFGICEAVINVSNLTEKDSKDILNDIDAVKEYNQLKVIKAMQKNNLSDTHFPGTTGYGYDDRRRDLLDRVFADVFKAEDALVRHQIVSGTQALALCMFGNVRPGDELLAVTGKPYDTLEEVIGIRGEGGGSLKEFGISFQQVELLSDGAIDLNGIKNAMNEKTKMILLQRSRGYEWRSSIKIDEIEKTITFIKEIGRAHV